MAQTLRVPATTFSRSFARYQDEAMTEKVIEVTSHGRVIGVISPPASLNITSF